VSCCPIEAVPVTTGGARFTGGIPLGLLGGATSAEAPTLPAATAERAIRIAMRRTLNLGNAMTKRFGSNPLFLECHLAVE
jgi:hypothetical protein